LHKIEEKSEVISKHHGQESKFQMLWYADEGNGGSTENANRKNVLALFRRL